MADGGYRINKKASSPVASTTTAVLSRLGSRKRAAAASSRLRGFESDGLSTNTISRPTKRPKLSIPGSTKQSSIKSPTTKVTTSGADRGPAVDGTMSRQQQQQSKFVTIYSLVYKTNSDVVKGMAQSHRHPNARVAMLNMAYPGRQLMWRFVVMHLTQSHNI